MYIGCEQKERPSAGNEADKLCAYLALFASRLTLIPSSHVARCGSMTIGKMIYSVGIYVCILSPAQVRHLGRVGQATAPEHVATPTHEPKCETDRKETTN
jgi:hypothetical protein